MNPKNPITPEEYEQVEKDYYNSHEDNVFKGCLFSVLILIGLGAFACAVYLGVKHLI